MPGAVPVPVVVGGAGAKAGFEVSANGSPLIAASRGVGRPEQPSIAEVIMAVRIIAMTTVKPMRRARSSDVERTRATAASLTRRCGTGYPSVRPVTERRRPTIHRVIGVSEAPTIARPTLRCCGTNGMRLLRSAVTTPSGYK